MIKKLKTKFVFLVAVSLFVLLSLIIAGMNIINYNAVVSEADETLRFLSETKDGMPRPDGTQPMLPPGMSPEVPYESRFFSVFLDKSGKPTDTEMSKIASVSRDEAEKFAKKATKSSKIKGFTDKFRYLKTEDANGCKIVFLDCGRKLDAFCTFLMSSAVMSLSGFAVVITIVFFLSGKIIKPISESYEKQKQFIADAGHDIKTPLTVIGANVDLLEMEIGENECLNDIAEQTKHLGILTNELITLARSEKKENTLQKIDFPISEVTCEVANAFRSAATLNGKLFVCNIQPMLTLHGNDRTYRQLLEILLDNAFKYSPDCSTVKLGLQRNGKSLRLAVENETEEEITKEQLERIFDRFYRIDSSRSSKSGGYGIGLSLAKSTVNAHNGKIQASYREGLFRMDVFLPT